MELEQKYALLREIIAEAGSAAVAFSGGVDSTLLLKVCVDTLRDRTLAITAHSETFPERELMEATELARSMGARQVVITTRELEVPGFSHNPPHRCFLCKRELFSKAWEVARFHGIEWLFDGSNADDAADYRPGRVAAKELGVRSPLDEAGVRKEDVRGLSRMLGLPNWDKPSLACLSSRFPYYTTITRASLRQVEDAEEALRRLGFRVFRVRHHEAVARIELGEKEMIMIQDAELRDRIVKTFRSLGYEYVSVDLEGYRTGSMN
ncbi:MAG: ATP-dependent sacrificial sulfur transferase LarE, partial [Thermodesulfobacteriota bacterium]